MKYTGGRACDSFHSAIRDLEHTAAERADENSIV